MLTKTNRSRTFSFICIIILASQALTTIGCVGMQSSYKPHDVSGGYGEEKLNDNTYVVFIDANGFTPPELTKKYFLRRSAQLTLKNDFDCFVILEEKRTLNINYVTSNKLASKTKYYSASNGLGDSQANALDENSLSGIIQMHQSATSPADCMKAQSTLELTNLEEP